MTKRVETIVTKCAECPFYERGAISMIADIIAKSETRGGTCKFNAARMVWPFQRTHITDETKVPSTCPLRENEAIVKIAIGA